MRRQLWVLDVLKIMLLVVAATTIGASSVAAQTTDPCAGATKVLRLNTPNRFHGEVRTQDELQGLFTQHHDEIVTLLRQVGFTGNPDDLFGAVRQGAPFGTIRVEPGTRMGWMFFRQRNQPSAKVDACWAGKQAFEAFQIEFKSGDTRYRMAVPKVCGNVALLGQQREVTPPPPAPVCRLNVTDSCDTLELDINATGTTARDVTVTVEGPGGRKELSATDASAPLRWRFSDPTREADFVLTLVGRTPGAQECRDQKRVPRDCCPEGPPSIHLTASAQRVKVGETVDFKADPAVSDCARLREVTIDGAAVSAPYQRQLSWSTPGDYTITARVTDDEGQTAEDSVTVKVVSARSWTIRPFLAGVHVNGDVERRQAPPEAFNYYPESGEGFGVQAEYRFNDRVGLAFGVLYADLDIELMYDLPDLWEMDTVGMSATSLFVGPMFHLTPNGRVDFFLGPLLHYTTVDDPRFDVQVRTVSEDFGSDVSFGAQLGLDVPFHRDGRFGLHFGTLYLDLTADSDTSNLELDLNPVTFDLGIFYRFK